MLGQKKFPAAIVLRFGEIEWYYFGEVEQSPKSRRRVGHSHFWKVRTNKI